MKLIGVIGGLSAESSARYYRWLNEGARKRLGGTHQARILMSSVDFEDFLRLKQKGDWDTQRDLLVTEAKRLEGAGAECIVLATNTMHKFADDITAAVDVPFIHIADATAAAIRKAGLSRIALLGTIHTMEEDFYRGRLEHKHSLDVLVPRKHVREEVSRIIYEELCHGTVNSHSRETYLGVIDGLVELGAEGVLLGCTEINMLVDAQHVHIPVFDTTALHVDAALDFALSDEKPGR